MPNNILYAITDKDGEIVTGGSSRATRRSKKPHVYINERNAKVGVHHVTGRGVPVNATPEEKKLHELKIVPFIPLEILLEVLDITVDMFKYAGNDSEIERIEEVLKMYGYHISEDGYVEKLGEE